MNGLAVHEALRRRNPEAAAHADLPDRRRLHARVREFLEVTQSRRLEKPVSAAAVRKRLAPPASAGGMTSGR